MGKLNIDRIEYEVDDGAGAAAEIANAIAKWADSFEPKVQIY